jgi:hypothetical protein
MRVTSHYFCYHAFLRRFRLLGVFVPQLNRHATSDFTVISPAIASASVAFPLRLWMRLMRSFQGGFIKAHGLW